MAKHKTTIAPVLFTIPEVAEILKVSSSTVGRLIAERRLGSIPIGSRRLVRLRDLDAFQNRGAKLSGGTSGTGERRRKARKAGDA